MPYLLEAARAYSEGVPGPGRSTRPRRSSACRWDRSSWSTPSASTSPPRSARSWRRSSASTFRPALDELARGGKRGKKDGQGLYTWEDGKPQKPEVDPKDYVAPEDLEDRLILPLLNEAVACLHDGVVDDADLLDAGVIFGTGFAPFRGGPIQYIRDTGVERSTGESWTPSPGVTVTASRRGRAGTTRR